MKKILSLALALAVCLSLTIPVLAADTEDTDTLMTVSNVIERDEDYDGFGLGWPMTCRAPAEIVAATDLTSFGGNPVDPETWEEDEESPLEVLNVVEITKPSYSIPFIQAGAKIVITEPGVYLVGASTQTSPDIQNDAVGFGGGDIWIQYFVITVVEDESSTSDEKPAVSETPAAPSFTDVDPASPYAEAIQWAVDQEITKGITETTFGPGNTCTISHILTFLWRGAGRPDENGTERESVAAWANGLDIDTSDIAAPCTRAMAVTFMWKAAGSPKASEPAAFSDVPADADYADAVAWAVENHITAGTGDGTTFSPDNTCTRGQIVTFIYRSSK